MTSVLGGALDPETEGMEQATAEVNELGTSSGFGVGDEAVHESGYRSRRYFRKTLRGCPCGSRRGFANCFRDRGSFGRIGTVGENLRDS